jgi:hypothetical protein
VGTLFRNIGSVSVPTVPSTPPVIVGGFNDSIIGYDPNIRTGYVDSYSVGYNVSWKDNVFEVRYVGNRGKDLWRLYNIDEVNVARIIRK